MKTSSELMPAAPSLSLDDSDAQTLRQLHHEATNGLRRVVALGLFCYDLKSRLKHGQFQAWLADHCPEISYRSLASYMQLTESVLEKCGLKIGAYLSKVQALHFSHGGQLLTLPEQDIASTGIPLRKQICDVIDGKSAAQLMLQFKQSEDGTTPKRGRLPGSGGSTKVLTTADQASKLWEVALENSGRMGAAITASNRDFFILTHVNDLEVNAQIAVLEHAIKLRRAWLAMPKSKRDPAVLQPMLKDSPMR